MKYFSKKRELCLVMRPTDRIVDEQRRVKLIPGQRVEFFNGMYETNDPDIIKFMDTHPYKGKKFDIVKGSDINPGNAVHRAQEMLKNSGPIQGLMETEHSMEPIGTIVNTTRPTDTAAISPALVELIDARIHQALGTIIDLLKKDEVKEEKVLEGKPSKSFKCPYCKEPMKSGFEVGTHKKTCAKRPKAE